MKKCDTRSADIIQRSKSQISTVLDGVAKKLKKEPAAPVRGINHGTSRILERRKTKKP